MSQRPDPQTADIKKIRIAIHGGAGNMPAAEHGYADQRAALRGIVEDVLRGLRASGSALDGAQAAVQALEDCPLFNAGRGAVLNADGVAEMDSALMDGARRAGACAGVTRVRNPVALARALLDEGKHVLLAGSAADAAAERAGLAMETPDYFITELRAGQLARARERGDVYLDHDEPVAESDEKLYGPKTRDTDGLGTVGAVVRDAFGRLAAATSTGGMTNKTPGRVGDSPLIGAGTWADDASCAVSCTGHGEAFIRANVAAQVHWQMVLGKGVSLADGCDRALASAAQFGGTGGLIAIDRSGKIRLPFTTTGMFRGWAGADGQAHVAVFDD